MATPQPAIFAPDQTNQAFLVYQVAMPLDVEKLANAIAEIYVIDQAQVVLGFGPKLTNLLDIETPDTFSGFDTLSSPNGQFHAETTQGDLFIWIQGLQSDVFDASFTCTQALASTADLVSDTPAFSYRDSMDLMQFEDGTANPKGELIRSAALVPEGQPGQQGSILLVQKWVHNLISFDELQDTEQSQVIGRDKETNEELTGDAMPNNAHVARTDLSVDGEAAKVWRRSSPFGNSQEHGLCFLSFACDQRRHQVQLDSMYGLADGVTDRILEFSRATESHYFFAPPIDAIEQLFAL